VLDDSTTLFTSLSVACEALMRIIDNSPQRLELGYARAACVDAKRYLDKYIDTRDLNDLTKANAIIQAANQQMEKWGHRV
jgi:hypothetical protein